MAVSQPRPEDPPALVEGLVCPACRADRAKDEPLGARTFRCSACGFLPGRTEGGAPTFLALGGGSSPYYEDPAVRDEYLAFHYPPPTADPLAALLGSRTPPLAERFPFAVPALAPPRPEGRALDVGCATGAVTLALAATHRAAVGLDRSPLLVDAARAVRASGEARYPRTLEGELREEVAVKVAAPGNAAFLVGDALALPYAAGSFETVVALNLVDRVPDPARALAELARVTKRDGTLIVSSPRTWLERFTPKAAWLGGTLHKGRPVHGHEAIPKLLGKAFRKERELTLPFFIPHHARSGQLAVSIVQQYRRVSA